MKFRSISLIFSLIILCGLYSCQEDEGPGEIVGTCFDGIQNQNEIGIDCGGSCDDCLPIASCTDGIQNQDEEGIDCGGACEPCDANCSAPIPGPCSSLNDHETMVDLAENSCTGYCVMSLFLKDCGNTNISGNTLTPQEYLEYFYLDDTDFNDRIGSHIVLVHEAVHSITYSESPNFQSMYCHLGCNGGIVIDVSPDTFRSQDLVEVIEEDHRTFRFDTYINSDSEFLGTQQFGIFGLLNEFIAYYIGTKAAYDYQPQFNFQTPGRIYSSLTAYYEFKYYILTYLIYAEENHPEHYAEMMADEDFKEAFTLVHDQYVSLVDDYLGEGYSTFSSSSTYENMLNVWATLDSEAYVAKMELLRE